MHHKFFRILFAAEDGGAGGGTADAGQAAAEGATGTEATDSLLSGATAETPAADAAAADAAGGKKDGEPGSPDDKDKADDKEKTAGAPEAYADFTLPEGVTANEAAMGEFKTLAKELNLPQAGAQRLVDLYSKQAADAAQAPYKLWQDTQTKWVGEIKADSEIGGAALPQNLAAAAKAIDTFGGPALREALNFTGAGNNPAIVKAFVQIGKHLAEDGMVYGQPVTPPAKSTAEKFYPSSNA